MTLPFDADDVAQEAADNPWTMLLQRDDRGAPLTNLTNALTALRAAPAMAGVIAYDEMGRQPMILLPIPGDQKAYPPGERPMTDTDLGVIQEWMQRNGMRRMARETVAHAVEMVAAENAYHPIRDYLASLTWDGIPRLDRWLSYYLGAEPSPYASVVGRLFLISMVARVMRPGCKADYSVVLVGPQGARKSTACAILAGRWFSDSMPDVHSADPVRLSMHLRGKWLIEIAEMSAISKAEAGALKAFITQAEEKFTPKYARIEVTEPRQCVFVGTTNKVVFLRDETGGRRFWPIEVGRIDTDALRHDRDQLFAEAVVAFNAGEVWHPTPEFEAEHIQPHQDARYEADAWEQPITEFVAGHPRLTVLDVATEALSLERGRVGTSEQRRISSVLERLGWTRGKRGRLGQRYWEPPTDAPSSGAGF